MEVVLGALDEPLQAAMSGAEALSALESQCFAAIVLDVQLPDMTGFEVAKKLREHEGTHTPIIFLSGNSTDPKDAAKGYELRAVDYLVKPCDPMVLLAKVQALTEIFKRTEELRQREASVSALERLEALSQLAQQAAHEINSPLQALLSDTVFLTAQCPALVDLLQKCVDGKRVKNIQDLSPLIQQLPSVLESLDRGIKQISQSVQALADFTPKDP